MPAIERAGAGSPHARSGGARSAVEAIGPSRGGRRAATGNHQGVSLKAQSTEGTATRRPIRDESLTAGLRRRGLPHLHSRADASSRCRPLDVCCRRRGPTRQDHRSLSSATFLRARLAATIGRTPFRGSGPATPFAGPGSQSSLLFWGWSLPWQLSSPQPVPLRDRCSFGRFTCLISQALTVTYVVGEHRLYLERNCRLPESGPQETAESRGACQFQGAEQSAGFGPAVEPRRK